MNILKVPKEEVEVAWETALPLLRLANVPLEELDEEAALADLKAGTMQLWMGEDKAFACLTYMYEHEGVRYGRIYMLGGTRLREWYVDFYLYLCAWAKVQKVNRLQIEYPRPGWKRVLSKLGFITFDEDFLVKEIAA